MEYSPEKNYIFTYHQLIFNKGAKSTQWRTVFQLMVLGPLNSHMYKNEFDSYHTRYKN